MKKMLIAVFGHYDSRGGTTAMPLTQGNKMDITGYDIVAWAKKDGLHSEALVLNNNSNTFILASRIDADATEAVKIEVFWYGTNVGDWSDKTAMKAAIFAMARIVETAWDDEMETRR